MNISNDCSETPGQWSQEVWIRLEGVANVDKVQRKIERVQRLKTAHSKTKDMLESQEESRDFHPGTDIASRWTLITAAYSWSEQAIKYLTADEKYYKISEWLNIRVQNSKDNWFNDPYQKHDLALLFGA